MAAVQESVMEDNFNVTAAFTGPSPYRFHFNENEAHPDCVRLKAALRREILRLCDSGVTHFLTGACVGVDMWAGEIMLDLIAQGRAVALIAVIPFREQPERWSALQQRRYEALLAGCAELIVLSEEYYDGCYRKRNQYLVSHAKYIICEEAHSHHPHSGTKQTLSMARKNGNIVICVTIEE
jgi:uncharacterized phage-like protein YoqJ